MNKWQSEADLIDDTKLDTLNHRAVRDLAWALCHPGFFKQTPAAKTTWFLADYIDQSLWPWLKEQDQAPEKLLAHLEQRPSNRLGIYFEQLLSFYFSEHPRFDLLAQNQQVYHQQKTLGEFDFIVYDRHNSDYLHLEAAVKFYLGYPTATLEQLPTVQPVHNWHHWVGPNRKDRLSLKMSRLYQHQLLLAETTAGKATLATLDIPSKALKTRLHLTGRLYAPTQSPEARPDFIDSRFLSVEHNLPLWSTQARLSELCSDAKSNQECFYILLPKKFWLSKILDRDIKTYELTPRTKGELEEDLHSPQTDHSHCYHIAELCKDENQWIETQRFFVDCHG